MKKFVVFLLLISTLFSVFAFKIENNPLFSLENIEKVCFVTQNEVVEEGFESVQSGDKFFNFCQIDRAKTFFKHNKRSVEGVQVYVKDELDVIEKRLGFERVFENEIDDLIEFVGYSPLFADAFWMENKKVNLQIVVRGDEVIVGYPVILTGY